MIKIHKTPKYVAILNNEIYKQKGIIGSEFYSNRCGKFKVLKYIKKEKTNNVFKIKFINTNEEYYVRLSNILTGEIKDSMAPTIYNIACLGRNRNLIKNTDPKLYETMLCRYNKIISRCYNKNNNNYRNYGKLGVTVSNEWLNFCNFYNDIIRLLNFDRDKFISGELVIDKDKKQINIPISNRLYSKETVSLLTQKENNFYRDNMRMGDKHSKYFIYMKNGSEILEKNINKFATENSISVKTIRNILYGQTKPKEYFFRYPTDNELIKIKNGKLIPGDIINK